MTLNRFDHAKKAFAENHKLCSDPAGAPIDRIDYNLYVGLIDLAVGMNEMRTLLYDQIESAKAEIAKLREELKKQAPSA